MRRLNFEEMENFTGGVWEWYEHAGCALAGVAAGFGVGGVAGYLSCLVIVGGGRLELD